MVLPELRQGGPRRGQKISVHQEMLLNLSGSSEELSALVLVLQAETGLSLKEGKKACDTWRCIRLCIALPSSASPALTGSMERRGVFACVFAFPCFLSLLPDK